MGTLLFLFTGGTKGAIDGDVRKLVKTGVAFKARSGLLSASKDTEIVREETYSPFEAFVRKVVFKGMGLALGFFDEFAVRDTGFGPVFREVVSIEFVEAQMMARGADNDAFTAFVSVFLRVHGSGEVCKERIEREIAHAFRVRCGLGRKRHKNETFGSQTGNYAIFQMP